jgi:signal transduction histidine kinase
MKTKLVSDSVSLDDTGQAFKELSEIQKVVQGTYDDIRESIDQLSHEIRNVPIISALSSYIAEFGINNEIQVDFDYPKPFPGLSPVAELQLFRITQEALTNVRRHAFATEVKIKLEHNDETVNMMIKDDGKGFSLEKHKGSPPG